MSRLVTKKTERMEKSDMNEIDSGTAAEALNGGAAEISETKKNRLASRLGKLIDSVKKRPTFYLIYAFLLPVALNYLIYLAMEIHPFGNGSVLVLDLNGQYVYFYEALRNAIYGKMSFIYSFCCNMGGEFMGIFAYYVASPFAFLVALFPQERILDALLFIFLLKTGISGFNFGFYLHRTSRGKVNKLSVVTFSVLYALTTYAIIHQHKKHDERRGKCLFAR